MTWTALSLLAYSSLLLDNLTGHRLRSHFMHPNSYLLSPIAWTILHCAVLGPYFSHLPSILATRLSDVPRTVAPIPDPSRPRREFCLAIYLYLYRGNVHMQSALATVAQASCSVRSEADDFVQIAASSNAQTFLHHPTCAIDLRRFMCPEQNVETYYALTVWLNIICPQGRISPQVRLDGWPLLKIYWPNFRLLWKIEILNVAKLQSQAPIPRTPISKTWLRAQGRYVYILPEVIRWREYVMAINDNAKSSKKYRDKSLVK
jgi:hypothetical protein